MNGKYKLVVKRLKEEEKGLERRMGAPHPEIA